MTDKRSNNLLNETALSTKSHSTAPKCKPSDSKINEIKTKSMKISPSIFSKHKSTCHLEQTTKTKRKKPKSPKCRIPSSSSKSDSSYSHTNTTSNVATTTIEASTTSAESIEFCKPFAKPKKRSRRSDVTLLIENNSSHILESDMSNSRYPTRRCSETSSNRSTSPESKIVDPVVASQMEVLTKLPPKKRGRKRKQVVTEVSDDELVLKNVVYDGKVLKYWSRKDLHIRDLQISITRFSKQNKTHTPMNNRQTSEKSEIRKSSPKKERKSTNTINKIDNKKKSTLNQNNLEVNRVEPVKINEVIGKIRQSQHEIVVKQKISDSNRKKSQEEKIEMKKISPIGTQKLEKEKKTEHSRRDVTERLKSHKFEIVSRMGKPQETSDTESKISEPKVKYKEISIFEKNTWRTEVDHSKKSVVQKSKTYSQKTSDTKTKTSDKDKVCSKKHSEITENTNVAKRSQSFCEKSKISKPEKTTEMETKISKNEKLLKKHNENRRHTDELKESINKSESELSNPSMIFPIQKSKSFSGKPTINQSTTLNKPSDLNIKIPDTNKRTDELKQKSRDENFKLVGKPQELSHTASKISKKHEPYLKNTQDIKNTEVLNTLKRNVARRSKPFSHKPDSTPVETNLKEIPIKEFQNLENNKECLKKCTELNEVKENVLVKILLNNNSTFTSQSNLNLTSCQTKNKDIQQSGSESCLISDKIPETTRRNVARRSKPFSTTSVREIVNKVESNELKETYLVSPTFRNNETQVTRKNVAKRSKPFSSNAIKETPDVVMNHNAVNFIIKLGNSGRTVEKIIEVEEKPKKIETSSSSDNIAKLMSNEEQHTIQPCRSDVTRKSDLVVTMPQQIKKQTVKLRRSDPGEMVIPKRKRYSSNSDTKPDRIEVKPIPDIVRKELSPLDEYDLHEEFEIKSSKSNYEEDEYDDYQHEYDFSELSDMYSTDNTLNVSQHLSTSNTSINSSSSSEIDTNRKKRFKSFSQQLILAETAIEADNLVVETAKQYENNNSSSDVENTTTENSVNSEEDSGDSCATGKKSVVRHGLKFTTKPKRPPTERNIEETTKTTSEVVNRRLLITEENKHDSFKIPLPPKQRSDIAIINTLERSPKYQIAPQSSYTTQDQDDTISLYAETILSQNEQFTQPAFRIQTPQQALSRPVIQQPKRNLIEWINQSCPSPETTETMETGSLFEPTSKLEEKPPEKSNTRSYRSSSSSSSTITSTKSTETNLFQYVCPKVLIYGKCGRMKSCSHCHDLPCDWMETVTNMTVEEACALYDNLKNKKYVFMFKKVFEIVAKKLGETMNFNRLTSLSVDLLQLGLEEDCTPFITQVIKAIQQSGLTFQCAVEIIFKSASLSEKLKNIFADILLYIIVDHESSLEDNWKNVMTLVNKRSSLDKWLAQDMLSKVLREPDNSRLHKRIYEDFLVSVPDNNLKIVFPTVIDKFIEILEGIGMGNEAEALYKRWKTAVDSPEEEPQDVSEMSEQINESKPHCSSQVPVQNTITCQNINISNTIPARIVQPAYMAPNPVNPYLPYSSVLNYNRCASNTYRLPQQPQMGPNYNNVNSNKQNSLFNGRPTTFPRFQPQYSTQSFISHSIRQPDLRQRNPMFTPQMPGPRSLFRPLFPPELIQRQQQIRPPNPNPPKKPFDYKTLSYESAESPPTFAPPYKILPSEKQITVKDFHQQKANPDDEPTKFSEDSSDVDSYVSCHSKDDSKSQLATTKNNYTYVPTPIHKLAKLTQLDDNNSHSNFQNSDFDRHEIETAFAEENLSNIFKLIMKYKKCRADDFINAVLNTVVFSKRDLAGFFNEVCTHMHINFKIESDKDVGKIISTIGMNLMVFKHMKKHWNEAVAIMNDLEQFRNLETCKLYKNKYSTSRKLMILHQIQMKSGDMNKITKAWNDFRERKFHLSPNEWNCSNVPGDQEFRNELVDTYFDTLIKKNRKDILLIINNVMNEKNDLCINNVKNFINDAMILYINNDGLVADFLEFHKTYEQWPNNVLPTTFRALMIKLVKENVSRELCRDLCLVAGKMDIYPQLEGQESLIFLGTDLCHEEIEIIIRTFLFSRQQKNMDATFAIQAKQVHTKYNQGLLFPKNLNLQSISLDAMRVFIVNIFRNRLRIFTKIIGGSIVIELNEIRRYYAQSNGNWDLFFR